MKKEQLNIELKELEKFRLNNLKLVVGGGDRPVEGDEDDNDDDSWA